jgi:hypothetical protein
MVPRVAIDGDVDTEVETLKSLQVCSQSFNLGNCWHGIPCETLHILTQSRIGHTFWSRKHAAPRAQHHPLHSEYQGEMSFLEAIRRYLTVVFQCCMKLGCLLQWKHGRGVFAGRNMWSMACPVYVVRHSPGFCLVGTRDGKSPSCLSEGSTWPGLRISRRLHLGLGVSVS